MQVTLKNNNTGMIKTAKVGFSWGGLLFGILVPMVKGDWKGFFTWILIDLVTVGIGWLIFPFVYNKSYVKRLITDKGYLPATDVDKTALIGKGIAVSKVAD